MSLKYTTINNGIDPSLQSSVIPKEIIDSEISESPLVSAVMVTRGDPYLVKRSITMFENQTWSNKELVIVSNQNPEKIIEVIKYSQEEIKYKFVSEKMTLGNLRNLSISIANGEYICQWDDDDLYDKNRILYMMTTLRKADSDAIFLTRVYLYWRSKRILAISQQRVWEATVLMKRSSTIIYPNIDKTEDTYCSENLLRNNKVAILNAPELYTYCMTGANTCSVSHFENIFRLASKTFKDPEAEEEMNKLNCFSYILNT